VTLLEVMVAVSLLGLVFMGVAFIEVTSAKQIQELYGDARTLGRAHLVLTRIRYKLCMGEVGSPVVSDGGRTLTFRNPNLAPGVISGYKLLKGTVYYYEDMSQAASTPGQGIGLVRELQFQILGPGNGVRVIVQTLQRYSWKLDRPFKLDTEITLRNLPAS